MGLVVLIFCKLDEGNNPLLQKNAVRTLGDGIKTSFGEDASIGNISLVDKFSRLYSIYLTKKVIVHFVKMRG